MSIFFAFSNAQASRMQARIDTQKKREESDKLKEKYNISENDVAAS